jgi:Bacterial regulatory proteins, gntR family
MRQLAYALPSFPGFDSPKTFAAWPVWSGSTTAEVKWPKVVKDAVIKWYHQARDWNALKHAAGRYGGTLGSSCLLVLQCLVFDCQNWRTGQLDPSYEHIAAKTGLGRSTVAEALRRLKQLGIVFWQQRSDHHWRDGKFQLRQISNAYALLPPSQWRGFTAPSDAPPPAAGTWGDHPPLPDTLEQAIDDHKHGASIEAAVKVMELDEHDPVALAAASYWRSMLAAEKSGSA